MAEPECSSVKRWKGLEGSGSAKTGPAVRQSCSLENTCRTEVGSVRGPWGVSFATWYRGRARIEIFGIQCLKKPTSLRKESISSVV